MELFKRKAFKAFLIVPPIGAFVFTIWGLVDTLLEPAPSISRDLLSIQFEALIYFAVLVVLYPLTFIIGKPTTMLLNKLNLKYWWVYCFCGLIIGTLVGLIINKITKDVYFDGCFTYSTVGIVCFVTFWLVGVRDHQNNLFK